MTEILLINPNTSARSTDMMLTFARPLLPPGLSLRGAQAALGAAMILDEASLAVSEAEVTRIGLAAGGVGAIIVAAFGNPGASRLRKLLTVPVTGIGEAAVQEAASGGRRFGIATTTPDLVRSIEDGVRALGLDGSFTGVRVPGGDPLALAADPAAQDEALALAATRCIELDGAEAVVIGGGPLSATAARLRQRFQAVIVEPVPAAVRQTLAALGYSSPGTP
jgi:Asp/Glu/hydantoin racemase